MKLTLHEYESIAGVELSDAQAHKLQVAAGNALTVGIGSAEGTWVLRAHEYVGALVVDDLHILIRPKIKPDNLFLMLEVGLPPQAWRSEVFEYETSSDLLRSIIAFFARTTETVVARGLLRSYQEMEERLVALRGRIDMQAQFKAVGVKTPVACRFDEFTSDVFENRYLRAAVRLSLRVPGVLPEDRQRLMRLLAGFEGVADVPVRADDLNSVVFTRLNQHYEPALRLAHLLLAHLTLMDQQGETGASSFLLDMNDLFERFVEHRLGRALRGRLEVAGQLGTHLAFGQQVWMKPDLRFQRLGTDVFVGDIKYKLTADARGRSSDYYQLLAYTTALDLPEGVLIYALVDGGRPERSVKVKHAGKTLHTFAIDLTGGVDDVDNAIEELADWIWARSFQQIGLS